MRTSACRYQVSRVGPLILLVLTVAAPGAAVVAQTPSLPGIVISTPSEQPAAPPPQVAPFGRPTTAAPAAPAPAAPPKPAAVKKTKPAAPKASTAASTGGGGKAGAQSIIILVNDEPITALDIDSRTQLNALGADIGSRANANMKALVQSEATQKRFRGMVEEIVRDNQQSKTRDQILAMIEERKKQFALQLQQEAIASARASVLPSIRKGVLDDLIEEKLKLQEAKRINVTIEDSQIDDIIKGLADKNKMTVAQFADHLKKMNVDINAMKARFRATLAWNEVVRRRFSHQVTVSQRDIDRFAAAAPGGEDDVELHLQRIMLPVTGKMDQKLLSERFRDADRVRQQFGGCKTAAATAAKIPGAKFEDLGNRKPGAMSEPLRSHLLAARDGEMVPPSISDGGIELYTVCARKVVKADEKRRTEISQDLQQKEFEILAKGHLRNLKQEAQLECRAPECRK